jgi:predicted  nucleic acid-binding Zn-ribbon protein
MSIDIDNFDFGFTAVDEDELEAVQQAQSDLTDLNHTAEDAQVKLDKLYNAILPLLSNLKKNPEKDYIHWPNRTDKVEEFEDMISKIIR